MEAIQETSSLIASDKVQGTNVYNTAGDNLGSIHDLMIDKVSGKVLCDHVVRGIPRHRE
jgi:uncharacterized protein YrrD